MRVAAAIQGLSDKTLWLVEAGDYDTERSIKTFIERYGNGYFDRFLGFLEIDLEEKMDEDEMEKQKIIDQKVTKKGVNICKILYKSQGRVVGHQQELAGRWLRCIAPIT